MLLQQADLVIAFGTRLGLQQTGFNWQQFAPLASRRAGRHRRGRAGQGPPARSTSPFAVDADAVLRGCVLDAPPAPSTSGSSSAEEVRDLLPLEDPANVTRPGYLDPFHFFVELSELCEADDVVIPCSSGGAITVAMQAFLQKAGQLVVTDKGLASMGYGSGGADRRRARLARTPDAAARGRRRVHPEPAGAGDGRRATICHSRSSSSATRATPRFG